MTAADLIRERIQASAGHILPWREVMRLALYEPGLGYYRSGVRRIGRAGDFYTSVSVGSLFGGLLAQRCRAVWEALGRPTDFAVIEQGAHDGTLAGDVLTAARAQHPEMFAALRYLIIEPDETLREAQRRTLGEALADRLQQVPAWGDLATRTRGVLLCNELLDAFPVHRVVFEGGIWREVAVRCADSGGFEFVSAPIEDAALKNEVARMAGPFAEGHTTEVNADAVAWLAEIDRSGFEGEIILADYGHAAREYFAPERREGTLRRYHQHRSDDRVLEDLGGCDLTAHVNFTRVAEEALALGWTVTEFIEQGRYLTRIASELMQAPGFQPDAAWMRQFQSLVHPGHLGHSFQVLTLAKGATADAPSGGDHRAAALRRLGITEERL